MREMKAILRGERVADVPAAPHQHSILPGTTNFLMNGIGR